MLLRQKRILLDHMGGSKSQTQEMQKHFAVETITQVTFTNKSAFLCGVELKKMLCSIPLAQ